jgi:hypothetical protein
VETRPETVVDDYGRAMHLAGLAADPAVEACLLVADGGADRWRPGFATPPWQLDGVLDHLADRLPADVRPGILPVRGPGPDTGTGIPRDSGWQAVLDRRAAHLVPVSERELRPVRVTRPLPALGAVLPDGFRAPSILTGHRVLLLPTAVCGGPWQLAGGVAVLGRLLAGRVRRQRKIPASEVAAETLGLADELAAGLETVLDLCVVGVYGQDGKAHPLIRNVILAGKDPVAVDAVAARLAGLEPRRMPWLQLCAERGLGAVDRDRIVLKGQKELMDLDFQIPRGTFGRDSAAAKLLRGPGRLLGAMGRPARDRDFDDSAWGRMLAGYRTGAWE